MIGNLETLAWSGAIAYVVAILIGCNDVGDRPPQRNSPSADGGGAPAVGGNGNVAGASRLDPDPSVPPGPSAGRRLTKHEYLNTVLDALGVDLGGHTDAGLLPDDQPPTGAGFRNDIRGLLPTAVRTDAYEELATRVAERVPWKTLATFAACTAETEECRAGFVRRLGRMLYRRPLRDADVSNLLPLFGLAGPDGGFEGGARLVLRAMLQSPHFLYRLERLDSVDDAGKPGPSPFELATRLAYMVWQSTPTASLLDSAERAQLDGDAYRAEVDTLLHADQARRGFQGYAQDWMQLYRLDTRTPNETHGVSPEVLTEMKEEVMRFVTRVAIDEKQALNALLTDERTEVGPALAPIYGVPAPSQGFELRDLSNDPHRVGILTLPGFMILRAAPERATIVHRGLMIQRVFLCSEVPAPPADAATRIESVPLNLTDRERFGLHTADPTCRGCHATFDPLGYPFEPFDLSGRFRTVDEFGNTLRSDGEVSLDAEPRPYADTAEFAAMLAQSKSVERCFVSKMLQYGLGRSLASNDETGLDELVRELEASDRTYAAVLTAVVTSKAFRASAPRD
jgi:hypothetical protein